MHIKICGITNADDALAAIDAGADYLGFNFYSKSPRYITPAACSAIQSKIQNRQSKIVTVGIFVNETLERVNAILNDCHLDLAQLHGEEPPAMLTALAGRAYKAFRGRGHLYEAFAAAGPGAPAFLVDAFSPGGYGGTGRTADWDAARQIAVQYPIFLAGGLTPENVAEAIAQVNPWGVDVASGVESAPGKKDYAKLHAFVQTINQLTS